MSIAWDDYRRTPATAHDNLRVAIFGGEDHCEADGDATNVRVLRTARAWSGVTPVGVPWHEFDLGGCHISMKSG